MLAASDSPRTRSVTVEAYFERWMAAWPAELPPTTTTGRPVIAAASLTAGL